MKALFGRGGGGGEKNLLLLGFDSWTDQPVSHSQF